ncbi:hypothetical protein PCANC_02284 [Puccinia coronata f. sp. avenae]|uniref:Uncharacterized protein n=1 Tax=Puccinia coronata f. sp. avenae TaxID=200324 RepID=A0A2N5VZC6_9BASI|nr:hypothetical protein PCANC_02284 [Puccinia coronata f. sp. avenae]
MHHHLRRFLNEDILSTIPPGANPFKYLLRLAAPALSYSIASSSTQYIFWVLFILHWLIVLFCLVVLLLLYQRGVKQFLWLVRRLNIEDKNGKTAPLFLVNTSVLIPITQCMGSLASQGYIFLIIKNVSSNRDQVGHSALTTMMVVMFSCEILTYWTLSHCFLVAVYSSYRNRHHVSKGARRWMPPPILINAVFFIFPIGVIAACITIFTWFSSVLNPFLDEVFNILDILRQGSSIWDQLRIPSTSSEQKYQLVTNLTQVASRAQSVGRNLKIHFQDVVHSLMVLQWVLLSLTCTAVVVFVLVFYKLAWRFHEQANQSLTSTINQSSPIQEQRWQSQGDPPSMIQYRSNHTHRTFFDTVRSNPQFLHLIIRAVFIGIAMLTSMVTMILGIVANERTLTNPQLRQALAWLATASGTWSAIPISWHCWRLYKDKTGGTLLNSSSSQSKDVALRVYQSNARLEQSSEPVLDEVEVERGFNTPSTLNFSKALEDSSHCRGSLEDSFKNFTS